MEKVNARSCWVSSNKHQRTSRVSPTLPFVKHFCYANDIQWTFFVWDFIVASDSVSWFMGTYGCFIKDENYVNDDNN